MCIVASWRGALPCSLRCRRRGPVLCLSCIYKYTIAIRIFQLGLLLSVHAPQRALVAVLEEPVFFLRSPQCDVRVVMWWPVLWGLTTSLRVYRLCLRVMCCSWRSYAVLAQEDALFAALGALEVVLCAS